MAQSWRMWLVLCTALGNAGRSLLALRPVSNDPKVRVSEKRKGCEKVALFPIYDTVSTAAGATWFYAGQERRSFGGGRASESEARTYRTFGIGSMAVFGASALYGYFVTAQCSRLDRELWREQAQAVAVKAEAARVGFPANVLNFQFGMTATQAEQVCVGAHASWQGVRDGSGLCKAQASLSAPDVRVDFRLGTVSSVALLYDAAEGRLREASDTVQASAVKVYGKPQLGPMPWPASCDTDTRQCLAGGERPGAAEWHWPTGNIELMATLRDERPGLELRFTRVESGRD